MNNNYVNPNLFSLSVWKILLNYKVFVIIYYNIKLLFIKIHSYSKIMENNPSNNENLLQSDQTEEEKKES